MDERLGRYRIVHPLATGGVGEIYLGRLDGPGGFSRPVVVKRLKAAYRREPSYQRALLAEARVGALLDHPGIVHVLELVQDAGELFIILEYFHGITGRHLLQHTHGEGPEVPMAMALHVVAEVLDALDYAHNAVDERGAPLNIVHRDISPENVFLCLNGAIKLLDFGIAQTAISPRNTNIHIIKGKARYISPEQAKGQSASVQSDVFACGLLLFELLTGVPALSGASDQHIMERARNGTLEHIHHLRPDLPKKITDLVNKALAPALADRYPSAEAMLIELRHAKDNLTPGYGTRDIRCFVSTTFNKGLEQRRRRIWKDQSTQVIDANTVSEANSLVDQGATPHPDTAPPRAQQRRRKHPGDAGPPHGTASPNSARRTDSSPEQPQSSPTKDTHRNISVHPEKNAAIREGDAPTPSPTSRSKSVAHKPQTPKTVAPQTEAHPRQPSPEKAESSRSREAVPRPRYKPDAMLQAEVEDTLEMIDAFRKDLVSTVTKAASPPSLPVNHDEKANVIPPSEPQSDKDKTTNKINFDGLRRAITEAYDE